MLRYKQDGLRPKTQVSRALRLRKLKKSKRQGGPGSEEETRGVDESTGPQSPVADLDGNSLKSRAVPRGIHGAIMFAIRRQGLQGTRVICDLKQDVRIQESDNLFVIAASIRYAAVCGGGMVSVCIMQ